MNGFRFVVIKEGIIMGVRKSYQLVGVNNNGDEGGIINWR